MMTHLVHIDDPDLVAEQVCQAFPCHRVNVAGTGADVKYRLMDAKSTTAGP
jgi:hypothetical protein